MPISVFGEVKIVATQDLGELGKPVGHQVTYRCYPVWLSLMLVPWLLAAALLLLPFNRPRNIWWIAAPPLFLLLTHDLMSRWIDQDRFTQQLLNPVIFLSLYPITIFWLLLPYLSGQRKWLACLKNAPVFLLSTLIALAFVFWTTEISGFERNFYWIAAGIIALANLAICSLQPWVCRQTCGRWRMVLGFLFGALTVWLVVVLGAALLNDYQDLTRSDTLMQMIFVILAMTGITFVLQLPFLLLTFFHPCFRARWSNYLKSGQS